MFFGRNDNPQPQDPGSFSSAYVMDQSQDQNRLVACYPCFVQGPARSNPPSHAEIAAGATPPANKVLGLVFYQPEAGKKVTECRAVGHILFDKPGDRDITPTMLVQWWEQRGPVRLMTHGQRHIDDLRGHVYGCLIKPGYDPSGAHKLWMTRHDAALDRMETMPAHLIGPRRPDQVVATPPQEW